jgi:hypothetical protein
MKIQLTGSVIGISVAWFLCTVSMSLMANEAARPAISPAQQAGSAKRPPNIVFIFCDDHAYQAIGAYGSKLVDTPNIDRLAKQGMRFDRCLVTTAFLMDRK